MVCWEYKYLTHLIWVVRVHTACAPSTVRSIYWTIDARQPAFTTTPIAGPTTHGISRSRTETPDHSTGTAEHGDPLPDYWADHSWKHTSAHPNTWNALFAQIDLLRKQPNVVECFRSNISDKLCHWMKASCLGFYYICRSHVLSSFVQH